MFGATAPNRGSSDEFGERLSLETLASASANYLERLVDGDNLPH
jgi:hypothetical protein